MSGTDAIVVGEGWISEHYVSTDATSQSFKARVLERRKTWDVEAKADPPRPTPRSRFLAARQDLEARFAALGELGDPDTAADPATVEKATLDVHATVLDVLELRSHGLHVEESGPLLRVSAPGITEKAPLVVVHARPAAAVEDVLAKDEPTLLEPFLLDETGPEYMSAARLVSALFVAEDTAPELVLVLAGRWAVLAEQERWAEGRYLAVDLQLVAERNDQRRGGEIDRALTCLAAESIAPDADGALWWHGVLEESIKHTVGVSQDLRDGVRESVQILANEVVDRRRVQGLDPLPSDQAQELAKQSLRFLYRILFLLYAEASPELGVLPAGAAEYDAGYSLDRLRELVQVELGSPRAQQGTHLYESLGVLFRLVDTGHTPPRAAQEPDPEDEGDDGVAATADAGLTFHALRADLFRPQATHLIDAVGLGNTALQSVLGRLLLTKEKKGHDRGFISYAELGINQLGAVYEGLMSYTGFFAETDLYEVAKNGDGSKGSWVVPVDRADDIASADFVRETDPLTGEPRPVLHPQGSFVFRLAGRERQQSASYYTPEVLTRFTVGQALEELLDQDGHRTTAAEILELTVCEPALGSGAFAIEAVRQLADQYLTRRQEELGTRIDPDEYSRRRQEVKAYLALHNVYGVDLNATAVELAEISLWLDTMVSGLSAPWFGMHLRRGNSLIGARRAVYSRKQVTDGSWRTAVPRDVPLTSFDDDIAAGCVASDLGTDIHHFLLPAEGWGAAGDAKEAADLVPGAVKALKQWRKSIQAKPSKKQTDALVELANRVEALWQIAYRRLTIAEFEARRSIPVWGADDLPAGGAVSRERIERSLADASGAYQRLRRVMDTWTALWFWPLTEAATTVDGQHVDPPTLDQWLDALQGLLGRNPDARRKGRDQIPLSAASGWDELGAAEELELSFAGARSIETVRISHPWLTVCERVAKEQGFFHWTLDFAPRFARSAGFNLQVGNPPWVQPEFSLPDVIGELDAKKVLLFERGQAQRAALLSSLGDREQSEVVQVAGQVASTAKSLRSKNNYSHLGAASVDLYKSFLEATWHRRCPTGVASLIHSPSLLQEERGGELRRESYRRLRRAWQFSNERKLFADVGNRVDFLVTVHGAPRRQPDFLNACYLLETHTVENSLRHDGSGPAPATKGDDGEWNTRAHRDRIRRIGWHELSAWSLDEDSNGQAVYDAPFVFSVNNEVDKVFRKLNNFPTISQSLNFTSWAGFGETSGVEDGLIRPAWRQVGDPHAVVLQGPHIFVCNPNAQARGVQMRSHRDWEPLNPRRLEEGPLWVTGYQLADKVNARAQLPLLGEGEPFDSFFRVAWRRRIGTAGSRSLQPAIIPPGVKYIETMLAAANSSWSSRDVAVLCGVLASIVSDFQVRATKKADIRVKQLGKIRYVASHPTDRGLALRTLRLNCLNSSFAEIWNTREVSGPVTRREAFVNWSIRPPSDLPEQELALAIDGEWSSSVPLRSEWARRQALVEIDALVALRFGLSVDDLCSIYRSQFAVVREDDASLRLGPKGTLLPKTLQSRGVALDRESDMRVAHEYFARALDLDG